MGPSRRRGLSPVISSVILAAAVLTIGGGLWHFSLGYCTVTTDSYIDQTLENLAVVIERFTVERANNNTDATKLTVWINNYGEVDITIDLYANSQNRTSATYDIQIPATKMRKIELDFSTDPMKKGEDFQIKVHSRRQNRAYMFYTVH